jgi:hypothetical protein
LILKSQTKELHFNS